LPARLHDWLIATWYGGSGRGRFLLPAAWLYTGIVSLRRSLYRWGWLASNRIRRPVVVVGNLTVGGTGKTPFVMWLVEALAQRGLKAGVAMRGYGGARGEARLLGSADTAATAGDEAVMLRRRLAVPVAIGARRTDAARLLERECDVVVCDDGLQHYALARDIEIAVVDGERGFGNGRLLPAGPLREPVSRLDSVDAVVVNGAGHVRPAAIRMRLEPVAVVALRDGARVALSAFAGRRAIAAAAIGNPGRFFALLRANGIEVDERTFPDHAHMTPAALGPRHGRPILMTEKDAVKCTEAGWEDAWYVVAEARVDEQGGSRLIERIQTLARRGLSDRHD
jgi:tetraacyldisaccharide 4'-kinase